MNLTSRQREALRKEKSASKRVKREARRREKAGAGSVKAMSDERMTEVSARERKLRQQILTDAPHLKEARQRILCR
jgi:hypothetical protein